MLNSNHHDITDIGLRGQGRLRIIKSKITVYYFWKLLFQCVARRERSVRFNRHAITLKILSQSKAPILSVVFRSTVSMDDLDLKPAARNGDDDSDDAIEEPPLGGGILMMLLKSHRLEVVLRSKRSK
jgi:hypothetical protein